MEESLGDGVVKLTYDFIKWHAVVMAVVLTCFSRTGTVMSNLFM
jgi:hypothetical protein